MASGGGDAARAAARRPAAPPAQRALKRLADAMEGFVSQLQCAICLCAYERPASLPCNHCFCEECIHRALELKAVCPICKTPAKKRQLRYDTVIQQLLGAAEMWTQATQAASAEQTLLDATDGANGYVDSKLSSGKDEEATESTQLTERVVVRRKSPRKSPRRRIFQREQAQQELDEPEINGNATAASASETSAEEAEASPLQNGNVARVEIPPAVSSDNGHAADGSGSAVQSSALVSTFAVGQLVDIVDRTWRGVNKPGGAARITKRNEDGTYNIKFVLDARRERHVPDMYILPPMDDLVSEDTPSRVAKQHRRKPSRAQTPPSVDLMANGTAHFGSERHQEPSELVLLCSGFNTERMAEIQAWADVLKAQIVSNWSSHVTHLIAHCVGSDEIESADEHESTAATTPRSSSKRALFSEQNGKRWVRIRSMKYLKALAAGRWIVSEDWLRECAIRGKRVSEVAFEAEGHLKGKDMSEVCRRLRLLRENSLCVNPTSSPASVGSRLLADFCFHLHGEFLPPMPPPSELNSLIHIGGGHLIRFVDEIPLEMSREEHISQALVIVSDRLNSAMLRRAAKELLALPQLQCLTCTTHIVSYQWVLNSISEAKLRPFV